MLEYRINVLEELRKAGYSTYKIKKAGIFSNSTVQMFRDGEVAGQKVIDRLCEILDLQPGDIIQYIKEEKQ